MNSVSYIFHYWRVLVWVYKLHVSKQKKNEKKINGDDYFCEIRLAVKGNVATLIKFAVTRFVLLKNSVDLDEDFSVFVLFFLIILTKINYDYFCEIRLVKGNDWNVNKSRWYCSYNFHLKSCLFHVYVLFDQVEDFSVFVFQSHIISIK